MLKRRKWCLTAFPVFRDQNLLRSRQSRYLEILILCNEDSLLLLQLGILRSSTPCQDLQILGPNGTPIKPRCIKVQRNKKSFSFVQKYNRGLSCNRRCRASRWIFNRNQLDTCRRRVRALKVHQGGRQVHQGNHRECLVSLLQLHWMKSKATNYSGKDRSSLYCHRNHRCLKEALNWVPPIQGIGRSATQRILKFGVRISKRWPMILFGWLPSTHIMGKSRELWKCSLANSSGWLHKKICLIISAHVCSWFRLLEGNQGGWIKVRRLLPTGEEGKEEGYVPVSYVHAIPVWYQDTGQGLRKDTFYMYPLCKPY